MKSDYHQVSVKESHKCQTPITVGPFGFYEYNKMPFGLSNCNRWKNANYLWPGQDSNRDFLCEKQALYHIAMRGSTSVLYAYHYYIFPSSLKFVRESVILTNLPDKDVLWVHLMGHPRWAPDVTGEKLLIISDSA